MITAIYARKSTKRCLLLMLCIFAFATSASAECAWVFWY